VDDRYRSWLYSQRSLALQPAYLRSLDFKPLLGSPYGAQVGGSIPHVVARRWPVVPPRRRKAGTAGMVVKGLTTTPR
jgi:hypothetical protein